MAELLGGERKCFMWPRYWYNVTCYSFKFTFRKFLRNNIGLILPEISQAIVADFVIICYTCGNLAVNRTTSLSFDLIPICTLVHVNWQSNGCNSTYVWAGHMHHIKLCNKSNCSNAFVYFYLYTILQALMTNACIIIRNFILQFNSVMMFNFRGNNLTRFSEN